MKIFLIVFLIKAFLIKFQIKIINKIPKEKYFYYIQIHIITYNFNK